ncbi:hypothetical protein ACQ4M4_14025 [Leptolyngbya sp. AN02str]|uniref:hypothetical protein n=1 Tax=Leptolyngbya sp. AN02str TaxID=3423363 RepID=UPI003D323456
MNRFLMNRPTHLATTFAAEPIWPNALPLSRPDQIGQFENLVLVDAPFLSPGLIDLLQDAGHDWICALQPDWAVEHQRWCLSSHAVVLSESSIGSGTIRDYVAALAPERYQWVRIEGAQYWVHTCCLNVIGMGRVRMVVVAEEGGGDRHCWVLATNRLGWSHRHILSQWQQIMGHLGRSPSEAHLRIPPSAARPIHS